MPFTDWETEALTSLSTLIPSPFSSQALLLKVILKSEGHADLGSYGGELCRKLQETQGNRPLFPFTFLQDVDCSPRGTETGKQREFIEPLAQEGWTSPMKKCFVTFREKARTG